MTKEEFTFELEKLGINLTSNQIQKLDKFYNLLITWNEKINLTTITLEKDVYLKHFYDSLTLYKAIDLTKNLEVLDVGTGAGFPGIVLKIVFPNLKITLLDSLQKRITYLNEIIKELDLKDIKTVCIRAEDYSRVNREKYDLVVARAVAHLGILIEIIMPAVKVNGYFVAMKAKVSEEISSSSKILSLTSGVISEVINLTLPIENSPRNLVKIKKIAPTNLKYPRRYDQIKKNYIK